MQPTSRSEPNPTASPILYERPRVVNRERLDALMMADGVLNSGQDA
jgi:hypothetical protein